MFVSLVNFTAIHWVLRRTALLSADFHQVQTPSDSDVLSVLCNPVTDSFPVTPHPEVFYFLFISAAKLQQLP